MENVKIPKLEYVPYVHLEACDIIDEPPYIRLKMDKYTLEKCYRLCCQDPMLEYATKISNELWNSPSINPHIFASRVQQGKVKLDKEEQYLQHKEVQDTLRAFGLDKGKFWYLCLMLKDVVDTRTKNAIPIGISPLTELEEVKNLFENPCIEELTLKSGENKISVTNPKTVGYIKNAMESAMEQAIAKAKTDLSTYRGRPFYNRFKGVEGIKINDTINLPLYYQITLFHRYLHQFLKPLKAQKRVHASKDKMLLISRMIFVLGISDVSQYNDEFNDNGDKLNHLKNNISRYKTIEPPTISNIYYITRKAENKSRS